jgi:hypothetical protein
MFQIASQAKIHIIPEYIYANEDFDYYVAACRRAGFDPRSGDIYAFRDEESTKVGLLSYDGNGFQWYVKRYSEGNIKGWPQASEISKDELQALLIKNNI